MKVVVSIIIYSVMLKKGKLSNTDVIKVHEIIKLSYVKNVLVL